MPLSSFTLQAGADLRAVALQLLLLSSSRLGISAGWDLTLMLGPFVRGREPEDAQPNIEDHSRSILGEGWRPVGESRRLDRGEHGRGHMHDGRVAALAAWRALIAAGAGGAGLLRGGRPGGSSHNEGRPKPLPRPTVSTAPPAADAPFLAYRAAAMWQEARIILLDERQTRKTPVDIDSASVYLPRQSESLRLSRAAEPLLRLRCAPTLIPKKLLAWAPTWAPALWSRKVAGVGAPAWAPACCAAVT